MTSTTLSVPSLLLHCIHLVFNERRIVEKDANHAPSPRRITLGDSYSSTQRTLSSLRVVTSSFDAKIGWSCEPGIDGDKAPYGQAYRPCRLAIRRRACSHVRGHKEESEVKWKADRSWWDITLDCGVAMRSFGVYARVIRDDTTG
jgi:hypothetical protein